jgi:hypothetical protein
MIPGPVLLMAAYRPSPLYAVLNLDDDLLGLEGRRVRHGARPLPP